MQRDNRVIEAVAAFPARFGLRAYPGLRFRLSVDFSYTNDAGEIQLVTEVQQGEKWLHFAKGTPAELRCELVA